MSTPKKKKINKTQIRTAAAILSAFTFVWVLIDILQGRAVGFYWFTILHRFGHSAIVMMLLSSLSVVFKNYRVPEGWFPHKVFGFYAMLYATSHLITYYYLNGFDTAQIFRNIQSQTFILFGSFALIVLQLMELTSIKAFRVKYNKFWRGFHYVFNAAVVAVIIHVALAAKIVRPIIYFYGAFFVIFITLHIKGVRNLILKKR